MLDIPPRGFQIAPPSSGPCIAPGEQRVSARHFASRRQRAYISALALIVVALVLTSTTHVQQAWGFGYDGTQDIHVRITRNALPFMEPRILSFIVKGNQDEDEGKEGDEAKFAQRHATNCRFRDSADYASMRYEQIIVEALRQQPHPHHAFAARLFGHILHGTQDFYSHSNWIPQAPEGLGIRGRLFDSGLGFWPKPDTYSNIFDDVIIIEGTPPPGFSVTLPRSDKGFATSAVPVVTRLSDGRQFRGLMTAVAGENINADNQLCPPVGDTCLMDTKLGRNSYQVCLRHGKKRAYGTSIKAFYFEMLPPPPFPFPDPKFASEGYMNLDGGGGGDWADARHYARLQTRHEWCRLLHLSRQIDPSFEVAGHLLSRWVSADARTTTPHIAGTACARGAAKRHLVEISATPKLSVPANATTSFVVFRGDFTSSARTSLNPSSTKTLKICANSDESVVAALRVLVNPTKSAERLKNDPELFSIGKGVTLVVQVPGTAKSWIVRDHRGSFATNFSIKVTPNVC